MTEIPIPVLELPFPEIHHREDHEELKLELCDWAATRGLVGPRGRERMFASNLLDWGLAMVGAGPRERVTVILHWYVWLLLMDDRIDSGTWAHDGRLPAFARAVAQAVVDPAVAPDADPMLRVLADELWRDTAGLGDAPWLADFAERIGLYLHAESVIVNHRRGLRQVGSTEYLGLRRNLSAMDAVWDLFAAIDAPGTSVRGLDELRFCATELITWINDIYGVERDLSFHEPNLVTLTRQEHGCSWAEAMESVHRLFRSRMRTFVGNLAAAPPQYATYAWRLRDAVTATLFWHRRGKRYLQAGETGIVRTERTVPSLHWEEFDHDPYPLYARLRESFPVAWDEPMDSWLISRYDDVRAALANPRLSLDAYAWQLEPVLGRTLLQMGGREHTAYRKVSTAAFNGRALGQWWQSVAAISQELIDAFHGQPEVDLVAEFCQQVPVRAMAAALGLPRSDVPDLQRWYRCAAEHLGNFRDDPQIMQAGRTAGRELFEYLDPHIAQRRRPGPDLLSTLCTARVDGAPISDTTIKGYAGMLLAAGSETTSHALAILLTNLLEHPDQLAAVRAEPSLIPQAWAEAVRRNPAVQLVIRQATEDLVIADQRIPAGAAVALSIASANRDPARFTDPDRFDIYRTDAHTDRAFTAAATHFAFGAGRHFCLGAQLSLTQAQAAIPLLLNALPNPALADKSSPAYSGRILRGPEKLLVTTGWPSSGPADRVG